MKNLELTTGIETGTKKSNSAKILLCGIESRDGLFSGRVLVAINAQGVATEYIVLEGSKLRIDSTSTCPKGIVKLREEMIDTRICRNHFGKHYRMVSSKSFTSSTTACAVIAGRAIRGPQSLYIVGSNNELTIQSIQDFLNGIVKDELIEANNSLAKALIIDMAG